VNIVTDGFVQQERYILYLKQQAKSYLLSPVDRAFYKQELTEELARMEIGEGKHQQK